MSKKIKTVRDARRYKYGSVSVLLTVAFIALVVVLNVIFTALSFSGNLAVDLTQEDYTSISDESIKLLNELGDDLDITVYFMSARDRFDNSDNMYKGVNLTAMVRDLAENYKKEFNGKIKVEYKEINQDPEFEKKYYEESTTALTSSSVIVQGKYHYRVLLLPAFFNVDENGDYIAFNGEFRFTTAMLQSCISEPEIVSFVYGHGEPVEDDGLISVNSDMAGLASVMISAGFEVKTVNLNEEEIDPRTEILVSYAPQTDFSLTETDKISDYLKEKKSFLVFVNSSTPDLANLRDFLSVNWGIDYEPYSCIYDTDHSFENKSVNISAKYPSVSSDSEESSAAYRIISTVTASGNGGKINTVMPKTAALKLRKDLTKDDFTVESVLTSYNTAQVRIDGEVSEEYSGQEIPTMLLSTRFSYGTNNVSEYAYVMLAGSTDFASSSNLTEKYGNKRILLAFARISGTNFVSPKIDSVSFGDSALNIELGAATKITWVICTVAPVLLFVLGMIVFFRRRHL